MSFLLNTLISALVIAATAELAKRSSLAAALLISLPLTSILALSLLYIDTHDKQRVSDLSYGILWLILPSLAFFLMLPAFLKWGLNYWTALAASSLCMILLYSIYSWLLTRLGISL